MVKIACSENEFISRAFSMAFNPFRHSDSTVNWLPIAVIRMRKSKKLAELSKI